jgi:hypothetical protein
MMGSVLKETQDREGVRIDAPHGWVINDVHHLWNKNETYHWETGNVFHMTSGQVYHANLNLAEVHTTTNALTMHVDLTPLNVHMRPVPIGIDVHLEASHLRKHVNVHGGHHHQLVSDFHQSSQSVHITSTTRPLSGWDKAADVLAHGPDHRGTMTLEADGEMKLESDESIELEVYLGGTSQAGVSISSKDGFALLSGKKTAMLSSDERVFVTGGDSTATLQKNKLVLESGAASVKLDNGNLTTNGTDTKLNGKVTIGQPAVSGMATQTSLKRKSKQLRDSVAEIRAELAALRARLP